MPSPTGAAAPAAPETEQSKHYVLSQAHLLNETTTNPMPTTMPPPAAGLSGAFGERFVLVFVGLPARGKQYMAERLVRYLNFFHGAQTKIFDLASHSEHDIADKLCDYLEEEDATATKQLLRSMEGIDDNSLDRLKKNVDSGKIAVLDSSDAFLTRGHIWSGASKESRWAMQKFLDRLRVRVKLLFIEVIVSDESVVQRFLRLRVESTRTRGGVVEDVYRTQERIKEFSRSFVTIQDDGSEDDLAYVKLIDYGKKVITNNIRGFLLMQIVKYLSHIHPFRRTVYLSRHGQSVYNAQQKIGGNPGLTSKGEQYAKWLGEWVPRHVWASPASSTTTNNSTNNINTTEGGGEDEEPSPPGATDGGRPLFGRTWPVPDAVGVVRPIAIQPARLWTSTMKRTIDTARHIPHPVLELPGRNVWQQMSPRVYRNLDEIFAGDYEGMTYADIERAHNSESQLRKRDKLGYRYPRGESYLDLIARIDPIMHELESYTEPLLIVSHQATLRIIYSYLTGNPRANAPKLTIPLHTVIKVEWDGWHYLSEERFACLPVGPDGQDKI